MTIVSQNNALSISGNIKSISHYRTIQGQVEVLKKEFQSINIHLLDSISITSSVIGYLCRLVNHENISVVLHIYNDALYELLDDLNLISLFHVQKIN